MCSSDLPANPKYRIAVWHGEMTSQFYVVQEGATDEADWEVVDTFKTRDEAQCHIDWIHYNNNGQRPTILKEGDRFTEWNDACPKHGGKIKKEYELGNYRDATIYTFTQCKCAVAAKSESKGLTYHTEFIKAHGQARLICRMASVKYR